MVKSPRAWKTPLKRGKIKKIRALYTTNWRILFWLTLLFWFDLIEIFEEFWKNSKLYGFAGRDIIRILTKILNKNSWSRCPRLKCTCDAGVQQGKLLEDSITVHIMAFLSQNWRLLRFTIYKLFQQTFLFLHIKIVLTFIDFWVHEILLKHFYCT